MTRSTTPTRTLTVVWQPMVATLAAAGVAAVLAQAPAWWSPWRLLIDLPHLAALITAALYTTLTAYTVVRTPPPTMLVWAQGAVANLLLLTVTNTLLHTGGIVAHRPGVLIETLLTPMVVVIDVAAFSLLGRRMRWWWPATWLALPWVYWLCLTAAGYTIYIRYTPPGHPGYAVTILTLATAGQAATGYLLATGAYSITRTRRGAGVRPANTTSRLGKTP